MAKNGDEDGVEVSFCAKGHKPQTNAMAFSNGLAMIGIVSDTMEVVDESWPQLLC